MNKINVILLFGLQTFGCQQKANQNEEREMKKSSLINI